MDEIKNRLAIVSFKKQLLFGYLGASRLIPNYKFFSLENGWGDYTVLVAVLNDVRNVLLSSNAINNLALEQKITEIELVTPDMDDYGETIYGSHALDSSLSVICILEFIKTHDIGHLFELIEYVIETIRMNISYNENLYSSDPAIDEKMSSHPFMQREIQLQLEQLTQIERKSDFAIDEEFIDSLLKLQFNNGKSNINIG